MASYVCRWCGYEQSDEWKELCPGCGGFYAPKKTGIDRQAKRITAADAFDVTIERIPTGIANFDLVLSGGLVKKFVVLLGGPKGSGKTTLLMQVLDSFSSRYECPVLFASAEEYPQFLLANFNRVGAVNNKIEVMGCSEFNDVRAVLTRCKESGVKLGVFDSLQKLGFDDMPPSVQRDIAVAQEINQYCKRTGMCAVVMNHMNKSLEMVGSTSVGHDVDTELEIHHFNEKDDGRIRKLFSDEVLSTIALKDVRTLLVGKIRGGESGRKSFWLTTERGLLPLEQRTPERKESVRVAQKKSAKDIWEI